MKDSRHKGVLGEMQWRDVLCAQGYPARRTAEACGRIKGLPDVIAQGLSWIHFEVRHTERLHLSSAYEQARGDAAARPEKPMPVVAHRKKGEEWLVTMSADSFFWLLQCISPTGIYDGEGRKGNGLPESPETNKKQQKELKSDPESTDNGSGVAPGGDIPGGVRGCDRPGANGQRMGREAQDCPEVAGDVRDAGRGNAAMAVAPVHCDAALEVEAS